MPTQAEYPIIIGGENLIDSIADTSGTTADGFFHNLGGSPYNVAVALGRQGVMTHYVTPISTDDFGVRLAAHLEAQGVTLTGPRLAAPTSRAIVTLKDGIPQYHFLREGTAERMVTAPMLQAAIPPTARHFHIGSLALAGGADAEIWEGTFIAAAGAGICTSLDPNVRPSLIGDPASYRARITRLLGHATIVKLSDEDLEWLYPNLTQDAAIAALRNQTTAALVTLTKGPEGAEAWTPQHHVRVTNPRFSGLIDTIGAGDTLMATLIAGLAEKDRLGKDAIAALPEDALADLIKRGIYAACLNCTKEGCNPPTAAELAQALMDERI
ncbi:carbohydrate kinase family protein [Roseicyclus sp.]|uniref:carbohydrate kinase family protein n=1 Tax=Roseicyclus sp. TaxID=1914329 RepID=UPI003F6D241C